MERKCFKDLVKGDAVYKIGMKVKNGDPYCCQGTFIDVSESGMSISFNRHGYTSHYLENGLGELTSVNSHGTVEYREWIFVNAHDAILKLSEIYKEQIKKLRYHPSQEYRLRREMEARKKFHESVSQMQIRDIYD